MNKQHTDLTFFTNGPSQHLLDRFKATLADTHLFDVLVGYFRASGFYQLYDKCSRFDGVKVTEAPRPESWQAKSDGAGHKMMALAPR